jgi:hypothetical protein
MTHEDFEGIDIRQELQAARSQPADEFVSRLSDRVRREHPRPRPTPRVALAFAATIAALAVAAAFGGLSEAASAVGNAVTSIVHVGKAPKVHNVKAHHAAPNSSVPGKPPAGNNPPSPPGGNGPSPTPAPGPGGSLGGGGSPSSSQYHGPCPPDMPRGPYIHCTWPPVP